MRSTTNAAELHKELLQDYEAGERAVTAAMDAAQASVKTLWRDQVQRAGLGQRLSKSIRGVRYPRSGFSMNAAAMIWTRAPNIISAHERGAVIRSNDGFWLAIPTDAAGRGRQGRKMTPLDWERRNGRGLRFVFRPGRPALLVADDARINNAGLARRKGGRRRKDGILTGAQTVVIFILVPQAKLQKKLDLMRDAGAVARRLPSLIAANWRD